MNPGKVMASDTDTSSDTVMSDNLGHGHGQTSDTDVLPSNPYLSFIWLMSDDSDLIIIIGRCHPISPRSE